jgi:hypothetical protein
MKKRTDKDIILEIVDAVGENSVSSFSKRIGYASPSALYEVIKGSRGINLYMTKKIKTRYPKVNELFIRGKSDTIIGDGGENEVSSSLTSETYTLNDMPMLMLRFIEAQEKTNELLSQLLKK